MPETDTPSLALENWKQSNFHHMVLFFLAAEWRYFPSVVQEKYSLLVRRPSLTDPVLNRLRF